MGLGWSIFGGRVTKKCRNVPQRRGGRKTDVLLDTKALSAFVWPQTLHSIKTKTYFCLEGNLPSLHSDHRRSDRREILWDFETRSNRYISVWRLSCFVHMTVCLGDFKAGGSGATCPLSRERTHKHFIWKVNDCCRHAVPLFTKHCSWSLWSVTQDAEAALFCTSCFLKSHTAAGFMLLLFCSPTRNKGDDVLCGKRAPDRSLTPWCKTHRCYILIACEREAPYLRRRKRRIGRGCPPHNPWYINLMSWLFF